MLRWRWQPKGAASHTRHQLRKGPEGVCEVLPAVGRERIKDQHTRLPPSKATLFAGQEQLQDFGGNLQACGVNLPSISIDTVAMCNLGADRRDSREKEPQLGMDAECQNKADSYLSALLRIGQKQSGPKTQLRPHQGTSPGQAPQL